MSEFKGTPGPWIGKEIKVHCIFFERHKSSLAFSLTTSHEIEANVNLILAAPEILEVLEKALLLIQDAGDNDGYVDGVGFIRKEDIIEECRAAIEKAKGEL